MLLVIFIGRYILYYPLSFRSSTNVFSSPRYVVFIVILFFEGLDNRDNKVSLFRFLNYVLERLIKLYKKDI